MPVFAKTILDIVHRTTNIIPFLVTFSEVNCKCYFGKFRTHSKNSRNPHPEYGTGTTHGNCSYDAYQIFSADVVDGDSDAKIATDLAWASDAVRDAALPVLRSAGMPNSQTTAQEAAEWLNTDSHLTSALSAQLARSLQSSDAVPVALNAGTAAKLSCGYWLIVADDDAIAQNEAGTAPIMALVGGSAVTVN